MKPGLAVGTFREVTVTVTEDMCPHFEGQLKHPVLATWTLVHQCELAGRMLLIDYLDDDEEGIGGHIEIHHRAPAPIGTRVRVRATCTALKHNRLITDVTATAGRRLLADGSFTQVILPKEKLNELFERNKPPAPDQSDAGA